MQKPIIIEKERLLLVEGTDEEDFFEELFKLPNIDIDNIQIIKLGSKDELTTDEFNINLMTAFKLTAKGKKAIGVILDCDDNDIQAHINKVNTFVDKVKKHETKGTEKKIVSLERINSCKKFTSQGTPLGLYVMPDCRSKGALETLCLKAVKDKKFMPCIEKFMECLKTINPDMKREHKREILAFLAAYSKSARQDRIGKYVKDGVFNMESDIFKDITDFLKCMSNI